MQPFTSVITRGASRKSDDTTVERLARPWLRRYSLERVEFEYDEKKSETNKDKHGITFPEATALWSDRYARTFGLEMHEGAKKVEARYYTLGEIEGILHQAVITYNGGRIRLISVRRLNLKNPREAQFKAAYDANKQKAICEGR